MHCFELRRFPLRLVMKTGKIADRRLPRNKNVNP